MFNFQTILHPTDFSDASHNALQVAGQLACVCGARLTIVHVSTTHAIMYSEGALPLEPMKLERDEKRRLDELAIPDPTITVTRSLVEGDPATEILRVAEEIQADLIVMGAHGHRKAEDLLVGSVADQVIRKAACPVLTVTGRARFMDEARSTARQFAPAPNGGGEDLVEEASEESFPASDPPAWIRHPRRKTPNISS